MSSEQSERVSTRPELIEPKVEFRSTSGFHHIDYTCPYHEDFKCTVNIPNIYLAQRKTGGVAIVPVWDSMSYVSWCCTHTHAPNETVRKTYICGPNASDEDVEDYMSRIRAAQPALEGAAEGSEVPWRDAEALDQSTEPYLAIALEIGPDPEEESQYDGEEFGIFVTRAPQPPALYSTEVKTRVQIRRLLLYPTQESVGRVPATLPSATSAFGGQRGSGMLQHFSASRFAVRSTPSWCSVPSPRPPPRPRQITPSCPQHRQLSTSRPIFRTATTLSNTSPPPPPLDSIQWLPLPRALGPTRALFLLSLPVPPSRWPSHLDLVSPLLSSTSKTLKPHGIGVNATYDGRSLGDFPSLGQQEVYTARLLWPDGHRVDFPHFHSDTLRSSDFQQALSYSPEEGKSLSVSGVPKGSSGKKEILVCTHGSRDCRCSDRGLPLIHALRNELRRKGLEGRVDITEIAHVGGHKYAANAILLPSLDMLSNLTVEHAPALLDHLLDDTPRGSGMWTHWRGRYGLSTVQQEALWGDISSPVPSAPQPQVGGEETTLRFKTFDGEIREVQAALGKNLLEVGKEHSLPALEGVCGGNLECATCHLYLPSSPNAAPVSEESEEELDMLGYALGYRDGESRLGCQIKVTKELGEWCAQGGTIGLPRY